MPTKLSRCQAFYLFSAVLISWLGSTVAARAQREPASRAARSLRRPAKLVASRGI